MDKMNPILKQEWVKALRSGEYKQGRGALRRVDNGKTTHCCLGVLAVVSGRGIDLFDGNRCANLPSNKDGYDPFKDLLGAGDPTRGYDRMRTLYLMNDSQDSHKSFDDIADWIEENL